MPAFGVRSPSFASGGRSVAAVLFAGLIGVSLLTTASEASAQATITGRVTDAAGAPLAAAGVLIQDFGIGTVTDRGGVYRLTVPESRLTGREATLTAQLIGYASQSRQIALTEGEKTENFRLGLDPLLMERLVAVGEGLVQRRETLGATVNTVKSEEITATQESNVVAALAGKAPNVVVTTSSGEPGAGAYINIRGLNTLGGAQPLFIVDGSAVDNSSVTIEAQTGGTVEANRLADLNPEDIESIEILKGGAATAIYGSRGANGVVLITTKSGVKGDTRVSYKFSGTWDEVTETVPLQQSFQRGRAGVPGVPDVAPASATQSWGLPVGDMPTFDHADELFETGHTFDHDLQLSGGSDRTTYFLSLGRTDQDGVFVGHSEYERSTLRVKASHDFRDNLTITGNVAYSDAFMDAIQKGSNISGIQLAALRTPPEFNNCKPDPFQCYLTPEGLHFSYRTPAPTSLTQGRGYDNPFWIANEMPNTSKVGRSFGNVDVDWQPYNWLNVSYRLGADYWVDERLTVIPKSSSDFPTGRMVRADLVNFIVNSTLTGTATRNLTDDITGSLTVGQSLNEEEFRRYQANGTNLIFGTDQLDNAVTLVPDEYRDKIQTDGIFAQANFDLYDQFAASAGLRGDKSNTFGRDERFWFPSGWVSWVFTDNEMLSGVQDVLNFGKLRFAYGESGKQPDPFKNVAAFTTGTFTDGWLTPNGLRSIYSGFEGVFSQTELGNTEIEPEVTREYEVGAEIGLLDNRLGFNVVRYWRYTKDAILDVPVAPSTGFFEEPRNGAEFENIGWEVRLDARPLQTSDFQWDVGVNWAKNESCVTELLGAESVFLAGFTGSTVSVVQPADVDGDGEPDEEGCHPFGVHYGGDWIRFGRDIEIDGVNIDESFPDAPAGAIYVGEDGLPLLDSENRVNGDANPNWTGSIRNTVTLFNKIRISALIDTEQGRAVWNGTKGALFSFGTHGDTEACHMAGCSFPNIETYLAQVLRKEGERTAGPGAGQPVTLNWANWFVGGPGGGFTGPETQFIEDASFVKLRDVSVSYTFDQPFVRTMGFSSLDVKVSGRNLRTWTDYRSHDPETNLTDQTTGRGLDYFNNPQTRSFVVTFQFNR